MNLGLKQVVKEYTSCAACLLSDYARQKVFYRGDCPCQVLFIGEAPGKDEDLNGEPFVGQSGMLLDSLISSSRKKTTMLYSYGITNMVACLPLCEGTREIRPPSDQEVKACSDRLDLTILASNPEVIILLGSTAKKHHKIAKSIAPIPTLTLQHPDYILRCGGKDSTEYKLALSQLCGFLIENIYG